MNFATGITRHGMRKILQTENLMIGYQQDRENKVVAQQINVSLHEGELVCLFGPNGTGKSTLMRTISGSQRPLGGRVLLEGEVSLTIEVITDTPPLNGYFTT